MEFLNRTEDVLRIIIGNTTAHMRLLTTLSHLEYCGFRKIASCCPSKRPESFLLRHAAEEARHAFFLSKQIRKLGEEDTLSLLGGIPAKNYLNLLDIKISKHIKEKLSLPKKELSENVYPLITLVVEMRAMMFYPLYQKLLDEVNSSVNVKSIVAEEELHLKEMEKMTRQRRLSDFVDKSLQIEKKLYNDLLKGIEEEVYHEKNQVRWNSL